MRQGQQSRRGRNRSSGGGGGGNGGGNRKPQNSLNRTYDSNGPDVKIRGTAMHIAEKYSSLARDAMASGDIVAAENYYQHAEHYNRIIMAAQVQTPGMPGEAGNGYNGANNRFHQPDGFSREFDQDNSDDGDGDDFAPQRNYQEPARYNQHQQPQPYISQPAFPQPQAHTNTHTQPQAHHASVAMNGSVDQPVVGDASFGEGDRAPRRRRRRPPMAEGGRTFNGRASHGNGAGHQPVVFGAPDNEISPSDEIL